MSKEHEAVLAYYDRSRLGYERLTHRQKHFGYYPEGKADIPDTVAQNLMTDLVGQNLSIKEGQLVLDAGCGYGLPASFLSQRYGAEIVGIDINPYEIESAQERSKKNGTNEITHFLLMDYSRLGFQDNSFDSIYAMESLSHSSNTQDTLKEFHRVLKQNGRIVLLEYTLASDEEFNEHQRTMRDLMLEEIAILGMKDFRHGEFPDYLANAGFTNIEERDITNNMLPSIRRLNKIARAPYLLVNRFNLQRRFINTTVSVEWYDLMKQDLIRYCIFTAQK